MKENKILRAIIVAASLLATAFSPKTNAQSTGEPSSLSHASEILAQRMGISRGEAMRRLVLQQRAGEMANQLQNSEPSFFAGVYITNTRDSFKITQKFKGNSVALATKHANPELESSLETDSARYSLKELEHGQEQFMSILSEGGVENFSEINIKDNTVIVYVKSLKKAQEILTRITKPPFIVLSERSDFPVPAALVNAGYKLQSSVTYCSTSFSVIETTSVSPRRGIASAGHCNSTPYTYLGQSAPVIGRNYSGNYDVQWHTIGSNTPTNVIEMGSPDIRYNIIGQTSVSNQIPGQVIQFFGHRTGFHFGDIVSNNVKFPNPAGGTTGPWVSVTDRGRVVCNGGDSGGAVVGNSNYAYGMITNCSANDSVGGTTMYYMPAERFSVLNIRILTQP